MSSDVHRDPFEVHRDPLAVVEMSILPVRRCSRRQINTAEERAMSRQVITGQRSGIGRVVFALIALGLVAWFIKSPTEAAETVRSVWDWFTGAIDSVETFFTNLFG
jgi:hypothetical protein